MQSLELNLELKMIRIHEDEKKTSASGDQNDKATILENEISIMQNYIDQLDLNNK